MLADKERFRMLTKFPIAWNRATVPNVADWLTDILLRGQPGIVHERLRGNILHVLCETAWPLGQGGALGRLVAALATGKGQEILQRAYPQSYQLYVYSRRQGQEHPDWTTPIYLNRLDRHQLQWPPVVDPVPPEALDASQAPPTAPPPPPTSPLVPVPVGALDLLTPGDPETLAHLRAAQGGNPAAIAWYLSEVLSALDVGVWAGVRAVPGSLERPLDEAEPLPEEPLPRLWVFCEAAYSPDPGLIAGPVTARLRQLALTQFRDAVVVVQVQGEPQPDWSLRVDLTPPVALLRAWGRWGDGDAIAQLIQEVLGPYALEVTVEAKDTTLHVLLLTQGDAVRLLPTEAGLMEVLRPLLVSLAPQGYDRAVIYGPGPAIHTPGWVHYLPLEGTPGRGPSTLTLAQGGDREALRFLLVRRLNPHLGPYLATGGIRVQLQTQGDCLHIMTDGPVAPSQRQGIAAVLAVMDQVRPPGIQRIRLYGRRAGQTRPSWKYGHVFPTGWQQAPAEIYHGEWEAHGEGHTALEGERDSAEAPGEADGAGTALAQMVERLRQGLLASQCFVPQVELPRALPALPERDRRDALKIGLVWGLVGLLGTLQVDWFVGYLLNPNGGSPAAALEPAVGAGAGLAETVPDWGQNPAEGNGFLGAATPLESTSAPPVSPFASFRSEQLDQQVALYFQRLAEDGPPDILIVGSSRALRGIDPQGLEDRLAALGYGNLSVFNFGINGATAQVVELTLRQIVPPDQLPRLILWADGARGLNSGRLDVTHNGITSSEGYRQLVSLPRAQEPRAANGWRRLGQWIAQEEQGLRESYQGLDQGLSDSLGRFSGLYSYREPLRQVVRDRLLSPLVQPLTAWEAPLVPGEYGTSDLPIPENSPLDRRGFLAMDVEFDPETYYQRFARVAGFYDSDYQNFALVGLQSEALRRVVAFTQEQGIPLVFINTPLTDEYLDEYRTQAEAAFLEYMLRLATTEPGFSFRDLGQLWPQRYDYFSDPSHLNRFGAYQVSSWLAQDPMIPWPKPLAP